MHIFLSFSKGYIGATGPFMPKQVVKPECCYSRSPVGGSTGLLLAGALSVPGNVRGVNRCSANICWMNECVHAQQNE